MHEPQISSANFDYRSLGTGKLNLRAVKCAPPAKVAPPSCRGHLKKENEMPVIAIPTTVIMFFFFFAVYIYLWG